MPTNTEAWVARADSLKLEQVTYADLAADEVLVDIVAASVCHSDVRAAQGVFHMKPPLILGHEGSGYVRQIGSGVNYVKTGDAVILAFTSCGDCRRCREGREPYCDRMYELNFTGRRDDGAQPVTDGRGESVNGLFFGQSSMSRVALVRERSCVKVEGDVGKDELRVFASLGCGVQTGAGAILNIAKPAEGSCIAIFGGGAVGLSAIMAARPSRPALLLLVDNSKTKLDMIPKKLLEGVQILNSADFSHDDLVAKLKSLTPDNRGMDFALDCVGHEAVTNAAYESLDKLGMVLTIGGSATARPRFATERNLVNGLTIRGTHQGDSVPRQMIPQLIERWRGGDFPFDQLLTQFKFEELQKAIDEMHDGRVIKPLLVT
ncbi:hypothetical protein LTR56_003289 [Elasticomyces elasticus]|nr:hypothetical protein LTR56_003289 [Elasticomyces elasticus]KAK3664294.1 hypothetical protein LTR22_004992 [Elasticomyces elasticus]KAK4898785.1 hypothetical protein LTR49_027750 [Elasticomyces elasticus]KAK5734386.1 hypothetical protein LTS12_026719 [Elasticomyces elasticus]